MNVQRFYHHINRSRTLHYLVITAHFFHGGDSPTVMKAHSFTPEFPISDPSFTHHSSLALIQTFFPSNLNVFLSSFSFLSSCPPLPAPSLWACRIPTYSASSSPSHLFSSVSQAF